MAGSMKRGSHETPLVIRVLFGAWSEDGRKEKFAANRNVFMEVGWWSKRGSSHGRLGAQVPVATPHLQGAIQSVTVWLVPYALFRQPLILHECIGTISDGE